MPIDTVLRNAAQLRERDGLFSVPPLTEMFYFSGYAPSQCRNCYRPFGNQSLPTLHFCNIGTERGVKDRYQHRHRDGGFAQRKTGFPHSDIPGSKVARHLPEAYRRHATSFIAVRTLGIHHMLLFLTQYINFDYPLPMLPFRSAAWHIGDNAPWDRAPKHRATSIAGHSIFKLPSLTSRPISHALRDTRTMDKPFRIQRNEKPRRYAARLT